MTEIQTRGTVNSTTEAYNAMAERWELPDALMGGEKVMKDYGRTYLPQEPFESDAAYTLRLNRSLLENYFKWAVENHTGRVFNKPIKLAEDTPPQIVEYNSNVDLMGNDINGFYKPVFRDMLVRGLSFVMVDYPRTQEDLTLADEMDAGFRPYAIHVKADQVIQAISANINGRVVLVRAHILEEVEEPDGQWTTKKYNQVRVLYPGRWEVWRPTDTYEWIIVDAGETSLDYIPLIPLYCVKDGFFQGRSNLQTLADLNRGHWQMYSDYLNIVHVAQVPILLATGFDLKDDEQLPIGVGHAIDGPPDSEMKYIEHTGQGVEAGRKALQDLEERMIVESLQAINDNDYTATGKSLDVSDSNASLQDLAIRLQDVITHINNIMCDFDGIDREGSAIVDTDFGLHLRDGSVSNILLKMRQNGSLSLAAFQKEMKNNSILSVDHDIEEDISLLEEEAEAKAAQNPFLNEEGKQVVGDEEAEELDTGKPRVE